MRTFEKKLPKDLKACLYSPYKNKNLLLNKDLDKKEKVKIKEEANLSDLKLKIWS
jgi:hypothetical protein